MPLELADGASLSQGVGPLDCGPLAAQLGLLQSGGRGVFSPFCLGQLRLHQIAMATPKVQDGLSTKAERLHAVAARSPSKASVNPHVVSAG